MKKHLFLDAIYRWRSHREYGKEQIDRDRVRILVDSILLSPSSRDKFPNEFLLVDDKSILERLSSVRSPGSAFLAKAALGVVVIAEAEKSDVWVEDSTISATVLQLCAESLGLVSCWIQIRKRMHDTVTEAEEYVKKLLGIPSRYVVECIISIGYPLKKAACHESSELHYERVHLNRYGAEAFIAREVVQ